jgi:hypothetical protein
MGFAGWLRSRLRHRTVDAHWHLGAHGAAAAPHFHRFISSKETPMKVETVLIIMFVVFGLFMLANWFNRPKK